MQVNDVILKACCKVMKYTLAEFRPYYHQVISEVNENGIYQDLWARRADMLTDKFLPNDEIKVLHVKRGRWQIDPVADLKTGDLYILINKKNLDQRINEAQAKGWSTHYLYSALLKNSYIKTKNPEPMSLFPMDPLEEDEHKIWRQEDCERILGDLYEKINRIIVVSVEYEGEIAATAHAIIYDSHYNIAEEMEISDYLLPVTYEENDVGDPSEAAPIKGQPLVKLKHSKKDQKRDNK